MPTPTDASIPSLTFVSSLQPASQSRAWQTVPHPYLPLLASASSDKTVRIYSLTSFTLLSTITGGHKRSIRTCAWKPGTQGESVLATGSFDASAGIWRRWDDASLRSGERERDFTTRAEGNDDGGNEEEEEEEDDDEWRFSCILDGPDSEIKGVAWSAGGQFLATCSRDKSVWIWEELDDDNFETVAVLAEHEGDVKCVAWHPAEDLLASGSYDDSVRLWREDVDDWECVGVLGGHEGTVWGVDFEGAEGGRVRVGQVMDGVEEAEEGGPRLVSCSGDLSVRVWRRRPKVRSETAAGEQGRFPSIIKTNSIAEDWFEEQQLPRRHERVIYAVAWSKRSGRVVTCGGDGKIVVYEERLKDDGDVAMVDGNDHELNGLSNGASDAQAGAGGAQPSTEWIVIAETEGAHDVYEVNHVCWALRRDKGKRSDDEEVIVSTGDDGEVKVWSLDLLQRHKRYYPGTLIA